MQQQQQKPPLPLETASPLHQGNSPQSHSGVNLPSPHIPHGRSHRECHLRTWTGGPGSVPRAAPPARAWPCTSTTRTVLEVNGHGSLFFFFFDTLHQSVTTFYKCYSIMKDFRDYGNQDDSTGDASLNRMRLASLFFPLQRRRK